MPLTLGVQLYLSWAAVIEFKKLKKKIFKIMTNQQVGLLEIKKKNQQLGQIIF